MENNNRTWEALSMKDRASFIKLAVQNGYKDIGSIRSLYNKYQDGGPTNNYNAVLYNGEITAPIEEIPITGNSGLTNYKPGTKDYINQIRKFTDRIYSGDLAIDAVPEYYRKGVQNTLKGDQFANKVRQSRNENYKGLMTAMNAVPLAVGAQAVLPAIPIDKVTKVTDKINNLYTKYVPKPIRKTVKSAWEGIGIYDTLFNLGDRVEKTKEAFNRGNTLTGLGNSILIGSDLLGTASIVDDALDVVGRLKRLSKYKPLMRTNEQIIEDNIQFLNRNYPINAQRSDYKIDLNDIEEGPVVGYYSPSSHTITIDAKKNSKIVDRKNTIMHEMMHQEDKAVNSYGGDYDSFTILEDWEVPLKYGRLYLTPDMDVTLAKAYKDMRKLPKEERTAVNTELRSLIDYMYRADKGKIPTAKELDVYIEDLPTSLLTFLRLKTGYSNGKTLFTTPIYNNRIRKALNTKYLQDANNPFNYNSLGGPLYNEDNPIEGFQGNPYIPVVRYDGGGKISTNIPTSLYTWHSFDNIGKSKDFVYNYLLHNKPKLGEHADKILEDTLNTIDSINFKNKYMQEGIATGNYDPFTNTVIRQRFDFDDPTFYVHEIGHATNKRVPDYKSDFPKYYHDYYKDLIEDRDRHPIVKKIDDILTNSNYKDLYWDRPTEVYSRLLEFKNSLGMPYNRNFSRKDIITLQNKYKEQDPYTLFNRYDTDLLLQLLNNM